MSESSIDARIVADLFFSWSPIKTAVGLCSNRFEMGEEVVAAVLNARVEAVAWWKDTEIKEE